MSAVIRAEGLTKIYNTRAGGEVRAVDNLDLSIDAGEIVAFLGPNGAGKTTTIEMLLGLTPPDAGSLSIFGTSPTDAINRGQVAALLQDVSLLSDLTVAETVTLIASTYPHNNTGNNTGIGTGTAAIMERVGIDSIARRRVGKCSGGEQQRLRAALALIAQPDLLILDEPTSGLDVGGRTTFWEQMQAEASDGRTIMFATHYLHEAEQFAERVVLINKGKVIADGPVDEIRTRVNVATVSARFRADQTETVTDQVSALPGVHSVATEQQHAGQQHAGQHQAGQHHAGYHRVIARTSEPDRLAVVLLTQLGGSELEVSRGSLDDAFVALTGDDEESNTRTPPKQTPPGDSPAIDSPGVDASRLENHPR